VRGTRGEASDADTDAILRRMRVPAMDAALDAMATRGSEGGRGVRAAWNAPLA
jgi:hypothetical protein